MTFDEVYYWLDATLPMNETYMVQVQRWNIAYTRGAEQLRDSPRLPEYQVSIHHNNTFSSATHAVLDVALERAVEKRRQYLADHPCPAFPLTVPAVVSPPEGLSPDTAPSEVKSVFDSADEWRVRD